MRASFVWLAALAVAAVAWFAWRGVLELSLYAWDTYPLIESARGAGLSVFTRELMDGRFPGGHFYRPLVELSFALDARLWGLEPFGYHLTDLLVLVVSGVLMVRLALSVLGPSSWTWAALAGLAYVLHPVHFEVLPLPPRRADELATMFTLLALCCDSTKLRGRWLAAVACACAVASKETGAISAVLVLALALARSTEPMFSARSRSALHASWPALAAVGALLVARTLVLGGLGGGARASVSGGLSELPHVVERYATLVLCPLPPAWFLGGGFALALACAVVAYLAWSVARRPDAPASERALDSRAALGFLVAWLIALTLITAVAGTYRAWYALPFVAPLALLVALAAASRKPARLLGVLALLVLQGWASPGAERWREIRASSDAARALLVDLERELAAAEPGATVRIDGFPSLAAATRHGVAVKKTLVFAPYSLEAYAALRWPERKLRFDVERQAVEPPRADEVLVLLEARGSDE